MSRSTMSKSRSDKGSKEKEKDRGGSTSVPVPAPNTDVIPGRFTESDWHSLVDNEHSEEFVVDIVGDIVNSALNVIYDSYIQRQLYPYTITQAKEDILQVIEWQFLARDEGEGDPETDPTWLEDHEPLPCVQDAWAQGSVPRRHYPPASPTITEADTEFTVVTPLSQYDIIDDDMATVNDTATLEEEEMQEQVKDEKQSIEEEEKGTSEPSSKEKSKMKAKFKYKAYTGRLKSAPLKNVESLDDTEKALREAENPPSPPNAKDALMQHMPSSCHSILKVQAGRPPGSKDVTYDEKGNVVSIVRLDPDKLPSHRVRTKYKIVDPAVEAAHARLIAMRTGRFTKSTQQNGSNNKNPTGYFEKPITAHTNVKNFKIDGSRLTAPAVSSMTMASNTTICSQLKQAYEANTNQAIVTALPPPLIESMELSPGVIVKEVDRIKRGPIPQMRHAGLVTSAKLRSLRPLASHTIDQELAVSDILNSQTPVVRPLHSTDPIPPITSRTAVHSN
ncbi:uncharacterized protein C2orf81 homolog [Anneissia japonica]|uniref:uncharacterized protein C2orf81 homolog n=1 Tax=Anneissia japonica TaxID=1529436 RepID=UPI0014257CF4|nr:uncharacterized protein C2orf81 homolog [Anneissia japonica]